MILNAGKSISYSAGKVFPFIYFFDSPLSKPIISLAIAASDSVYCDEHEMHRQISEFRNGDHPRVLCSDSDSSFFSNKAWALVTSDKHTVFAIQGSRAWFDYVANLDCQPVPFEVGDNVCNQYFIPASGDFTSATLSRSRCTRLIPEWPG